jgi:hypothetical protein
MGKFAYLLVLVCACGQVVADDDDDGGGGPVTVTISPASPVTTDDLMATVTDGGSRTFTYRWSATGHDDAMGASLPASATTKGDVWTVEVLESGTVVGMAQATIQNSPVSLTAPKITGPKWTTAPLTCAVQATDPDETDQVTLTITWEKDGAAYTGTTAMTVNANDTIPKDTVQATESYKCLVTASDGTTMAMGDATATITPRIAYTVSENLTSAVLQTIDLDTGVLTDIGPTGVGYNFGDLAWDRVAQKLYMVDGRGANSLYIVDTTTGAATLVGVHGLTDLFSIGVAPTGLYGATTSGGNVLYKLDTTTGAATQVGALSGPAGRVEGLVYDSAHDRMVGETTSGVFWTVDVSNGAVTQLAGNTGMNDFGLTYDPYVDRYYTMDYNARLQVFDPTTFVATIVMSNLGAHTSIALPLPAP